MKLAIKVIRFFTTFAITYVFLVAAIWSFLEAYTYFKGDDLKGRLGGEALGSILFYGLPVFIALVTAVVKMIRDKKSDVSPEPIKESLSTRSGFHVNDVGGSVSIEAEGDVVAGNKTIHEYHYYTRREDASPSSALNLPTPEDVPIPSIEQKAPHEEKIESIDNLLQKFKLTTSGYLDERALSMPIIGSLSRREEINIIKRDLDRHKAILLVGEAGSGKSGIVTKLTKELQERGIPVLFLRASDFPQNVDSIKKLQENLPTDRNSPCKKD